jgi:hypothetical protein
MIYDLDGSGGKIHYEGQWERVGPWKSRLFWALLTLPVFEKCSLVPFQGPKKSRFSGPTPSNDPRNDVAPLKTITYRAIKTTGTLIGWWLGL